MALSKVVVAGGTGFVGKRLSAALQNAGASVTILTRSANPSGVPSGVETQVWTPASSTDGSGWQSVLENADAVINLCGYPVVSRWTEGTKREIIDSRIETTNALVDAIAELAPAQRPKCFVGSSATGYYGSSASAVFDEGSSPDNGFLGDLCVRWEKAAMSLADKAPEVRVVVVRTGVVLGNGGGAIGKMLPIFKMYFGGPIGSGEQWMPWIHIDDLVRIFMRAAESASMSGAYNGTSPEPVTMGELSAALAKNLNRPNLFPVPGLAIKVLFGEGAEVLLEGNRAIPKRLLDDGFEYSYGNVDDALGAIVNES